jgi:phosphatidylethanolamine-binding protein (PEBP) family uncharacterized protein
MGRGLLNATVGAALALGVAVSGCGGSSSTSSSTQAAKSAAKPARTVTPGGSQEHSVTSNVTLSSPAFRTNGFIPARYTCDGADQSPPLSWKGVPAGTAELALFVADPAERARGGGPSTFWAVAGLPPTLKGLAAGKLPPGAIVGRNTLGQTRYSICPARGRTQSYLIALYTLPHPIAVKPGFAADPFQRTVERKGEYEGYTAFSYARR